MINDTKQTAAYESYFSVVNKRGVTGHDIIDCVKKLPHLYVTTACRDAAKKGDEYLTLMLIEIAHERKEPFAASSAMIAAYEYDHDELYKTIKQIYFRYQRETRVFTVEELL